MRKVIYPPEHLDFDGPVIFVGGPILGAVNWQTEATEIINIEAPEIMVASPRRVYSQGDSSVDERIDWETYHLRRAGEKGTVLFFLDEEVMSVPGHPFAETSRVELGEWKVMHQVYGCNLALGIHPDFPGGYYIKRRFNQDCPSINIKDNLRDTCHEAISLARDDIRKKLDIYQDK